jgi:membrane-bound metal-dependent hydrolase YbcI (DUF457 family)
MLVFCHLFAGAAIGLVLARATGDRRLVTVGMLAGILPDLVDKPLGHIFLASTLDNGRLVAHSLVFLLLLFVAGLLVFRRRGPLLAPVLALGVLSHQLLDAMWRDPPAWFYPFLGPFVPGHYPDYFLSGLAAELGSPAEWLFGAAVLALLAGVVRPPFVRADHARLARRLLPVVALAVGIAGLAALVCAIAGQPLALAPALRPADLALLGLAALGGAVVVGVHDPAGRERPEERGEAVVVLGDHPCEE